MNTLSNMRVECPSEVKILVIDDQETDRRAAKLFCEIQIKELGSSKLKIQEADSISKALDLMSKETFHVLLLDRDLGYDEKGNAIDAIEFIPELLNLQPLVQILMLTASEDFVASCEAFQKGAVGYLLKRAEPKYAEYRNHQIKLAIVHAVVSQDRERLKSKTETADTDFICHSPAMKQLNYQLEALADFDKPVLFLGESGLGKTSAAKRLHQMRAKALGQTNRPFFNLNVANFKEVAESELFGHEPNSFTGAGNQVKLGYFELANDGDIFLDEIGDASPELQAKLLKVIEEREFNRVGGKKTLKTTARVILATHRDLKELVDQGKFRKDLYMRIVALKVEMPPLEERKEDLPSIIRALLARTCRGSRKRLMFEELPSELLAHWHRPNIEGNIRGIENDIDRLVVLSPQKDNGPLDLSRWKSTLGLTKRGRPATTSITAKIGLDHLLNLPTDVLGPDFPGLTQVKKILEEKILEEASRKFPNLTTRAHALRVNPANAYRKYQQIHSKEHISIDSSEVTHAIV